MLELFPRHPWRGKHLKGCIVKSVTEIWDSMAYDYDIFSSSNESYSNRIEWPCIENILPDLRNKRILDIGCGSGRYSFIFDKYKPNNITGIDISKVMIDLANKQRPKESKTVFYQSSIEEIDSLNLGKYDFAFSSTASHYFTNLEKAFSTVFKYLVGNGVFILSAMHPIYTASYPLHSKEDWVFRYLDKNKREYIQPWTKRSKQEVKEICYSFQYTISDYYNSLCKVGFRIKSIQEPEPPYEWFKKDPEKYESVINEPLYIIFECCR
jgi:Methylase involved in ubiquinone/menaquinone biosynthesis